MTFFGCEEHPIKIQFCTTCTAIPQMVLHERYIHLKERKISSPVTPDTMPYLIDVCPPPSFACV